RGVLPNAQRLVVVLVLDRHPFRPRKLVRWRGRRDARTCRLDLRGGHVRSGQQRRLEHLVDRVHELDVDRVDDLLRYIDEILLVLLRHEEDLDPGAVRREELLLTPPMGKTSPRSVISPVIATSVRTLRPVRADTIAVAMVTPADGPSLGMAPAGTWMCMAWSLKKPFGTPSSA